ncbi:ammonium transporter [Kitasatospora sp. NBC_01287]|uniref:ammonium transporter n=1 Tax=Kitasatospora sp. NBC_01287 TaxID=2903573 RepID=UPI00225A613E|nr:ammonium transporter [Kitasatospora sp. NBC_01287]MCX4744973.1 ammonium transporter [Kitasatospora sp. NBC_01287]
MTPALDSGNSAWLMMAAAMVLLMAPGLAFFYGGMVKTGQVIAMLKMCFVCLVLVTLIWVTVGYSLAFGPDAGGLGVIGGLDHVFMSGVGMESNTNGVPTVAFAVFHMSFAIVTVALISGSVAGRATMKGWIAFVCAWTLLVYIPLAHWVFAPDGWVVKQVGAVDFSGGTVVELSSGAAGLALALVAGKRQDFERTKIRPHNLPLVVVGLSLLWFGWFGFNTGSSLGTPGAAAMGVMNTQLAAGAAMAGWAATVYLRTRKVGLLDMCMGAVTGMVAMTPLAGGVSMMWATVIGFLAGLTCAFAISWKYRFGVDDTLDVVGIHGWGGLFGMVMVGLAATGVMTGKKGVFYGGGWDLLGKQLVAVLVLGLFSFGMTAVIGKVVDLTVGLRQSSTAEEHEQVYQNDWDAQFKEIADALRGSGGTAAEAGPDASALLEQVRRMLAPDQPERERLSD